MRRLFIAATMLATASAAQSTYSEETARGYLWLNQAVGVRDTSLLQTWSCGLACEEAENMTDVRLLTSPDDGTLGIAGRRNGDCVIVFRGSKNLLNWLYDAGFVKTAPYASCPECKVHSGFLTSWRSLQDQAEAALEDLGCATRSLKLTGHSLGGAMASLAAWDLLEKGYNVSEIYTFGQPRVGNWHWASAFQELTKGRSFYRVVHYKDPASHFPLKNFNFYHAGPEVYYSTWVSGPFVVCPTGEDEACSGRWSMASCIWHTCLHCSYLGMNPCTPGATAPSCSSRRLLDVQV